MIWRAAITPTQIEYELDRVSVHFLRQSRTSIHINCVIEISDGSYKVANKLFKNSRKLRTLTHAAFQLKACKWFTELQEELEDLNADALLQ